ncbi:unnamed protein product [Closterium sp. NIES-65]|nr:unnamed protein product [Closterium sp. NIES-65]
MVASFETLGASLVALAGVPVGVDIKWSWAGVGDNVFGRLAVAPRGAGSGATWCWQWRHVVLAVAPRGAGSGATWCWQWRHVVLAVAPRGAGSGATWCWQWRHVVLAVAPRGAGSGTHGAAGTGGAAIASLSASLTHATNPSLSLTTPSRLAGTWYGMVWCGMACYGVVWRGMVWYGVVHGEEGQRRMREAGQLAARVRDHAGTLVKPGVTTDEIDRAVHEMIIEAGAYPSPLNYAGFPKSVCTSVNECICHGIPDSRPLEDGDIINIDVTVYLNAPPSTVYLGWLAKLSFPLLILFVLLCCNEATPPPHPTRMGT